MKLFLIAFISIAITGCANTSPRGVNFSKFIDENNCYKTKLGVVYCETGTYRYFDPSQ